MPDVYPDQPPGTLHFADFAMLQTVHSRGENNSPTNPIQVGGLFFSPNTVT